MYVILHFSNSISSSAREWLYQGVAFLQADNTSIHKKAVSMMERFD